MTTLAVNSEGMAADTLVVSGDSVFSLKGKKIWRIRDHLVGYAGLTAHGNECIEFIKAHKDLSVLDCLREHNPNYHSSFQMLVKTPNGKVYRYDGEGCPTEIAEGYATLGSGCDFALAALMAGAPLRKAVEIGIQLDTKSGGRISFFKG